MTTGHMSHSHFIEVIFLPSAEWMGWNFIEYMLLPGNGTNKAFYEGRSVFYPISRCQWNWNEKAGLMSSE